MLKWKWFWSKYPAPQAGSAKTMREVYQEVANKFALPLRQSANRILLDYMGAVLYEMNVRLYADLEAGKIPAERILGGLDTLGSMVEILYDLEQDHEREHKKSQTFTEASN
ncbi:MAG: hypothetical protein WC495_05370 [Patescibacteria group bacterium]|jgi:hypothetical protein